MRRRPDGGEDSRWRREQATGRARRGLRGIVCGNPIINAHLAMIEATVELIRLMTSFEFNACGANNSYSDMPVDQAVRSRAVPVTLRKSSTPVIRTRPKKTISPIETIAAKAVN